MSARAIFARAGQSFAWAGSFPTPAGVTGGRAKGLDVEGFGVEGFGVEGLPMSEAA